MNIHTKFSANWPSRFREEDLNVKVYGQSPRRRLDNDNVS